jgi:DNA-directed RNA polymerase specialized sigma24 family protein
MGKAKSAARIKIVFEQEASGWRVSAPEIKGAEAWGRSLSESRRKIKKALGAAGRKAELVEDVRLPGTARKELERYAATRARVLAELAGLRKTTRAVVALLTKKHGISLRDASSLLGLSRERVRQLTV